MSILKPQLGQDEIYALLKSHFDAPIGDLEMVQGGETAQALSFAVDGVEYILRVNSGRMATSYRKEEYIYRRFAAPGLPIPEVKAGRWGDYNYAISRRAPGVTVNKLPRDDYTALMPAIVETAFVIHQSDIGDKPGYGIFDDDGVGMAESWQAALAMAYEEEEEDGYFGKWHRMFDETFLERDVFQRIFDEMMRLSEFCPTERYLVHGDLGFDNILAEPGRITGVIDWMNARYGDFVYDVAWLTFWPPADDYPTLFRQYYGERGVEIPHFEERLLCYYCYIGLDGLRFFTKAGLESHYSWARDHILGLLKKAGRG